MDIDNETSFHMTAFDCASTARAVMLEYNCWYNLGTVLSFLK
jgi:hypothetical protein